MIGMATAALAWGVAAWWTGLYPSAWTLVLWIALPAALIAASLVRAGWQRHGRERGWRWMAALALAAGVALGWDAMARHTDVILLAQHAGVQALLAWVFGRTLIGQATPLCTEFAAWVHEPMSPAVRRYTRGVTGVWALFFAAVALASLLLFWLAPLSLWTAFATLVTPVLTGALFLGEAFARRWFLPPEDRVGLADTWRSIQARAAALRRGESR